MTSPRGNQQNIIPSTAPMDVCEPVRPQSLEVYSNPASDILCLKNLHGEAVDYAILNAMGRQVAAGTSSGTIPVADLQKGLYFLRVASRKRHVTVRFVVR